MSINKNFILRQIKRRKKQLLSKILSVNHNQTSSINNDKMFTYVQTRIRQLANITSFDIELFLKQLATLIKAGVPLNLSLDMLEKSQEKYQLRLVLYHIKKEVLSGKTLFEALASHENYFDHIICHLVKIGEQTGKLDDLLHKSASYIMKNNLLRQKIKQALFYPCLILIMALIVILSLFIFVIPRFADLFTGSAIKLPSTTRAIFYLSHLINEKGKYLLVLITVMLSLFVFNRVQIKNWWRNTLFSFPLFHAVIKKINLARFSRTLAITFAAGVPIIKALQLAINVSNERKFIIMANEIKSKVTTGCTLNDSMKACHYFPIIMVQMIKIGEETGMLESMLHKTADFLEQDIDVWFQYAGKFLEPLIMIILGVLIGGLIISLYLPIFKLSSLL